MSVDLFTQPIVSSSQGNLKILRITYTGDGNASHLIPLPVIPKFAQIGHIASVSMLFWISSTNWLAAIPPNLILQEGTLSQIFISGAIDVGTLATLTGFGCNNIATDYVIYILA